MAVVLVISRAGIGPKPKEVRANAGRKKGKKISYSQHIVSVLLMMYVCMIFICETETKSEHRRARDDRRCSRIIDGP